MPPTISSSVRFKPQLKDSLDKLAQATGENRNTLIVLAIEKLLQEHPEVNKA